MTNQPTPRTTDLALCTRCRRIYRFTIGTTPACPLATQVDRWGLACFQARQVITARTAG